MRGNGRIGLLIAATLVVAWSTSANGQGYYYYPGTAASPYTTGTYSYGTTYPYSTGTYPYATTYPSTTGTYSYGTTYPSTSYYYGGAYYGRAYNPGGLGGPYSGLGVRPGVGFGGPGIGTGYNPGGVGGRYSGLGVRPGAGFGGLGRRR